eukprot:6921053-Lingulodinium_polyedra.AAC.1
MPALNIGAFKGLAAQQLRWKPSSLEFLPGFAATRKPVAGKLDIGGGYALEQREALVLLGAGLDSSGSTVAALAHRMAKAS